MHFHAKSLRVIVSNFQPLWIHLIKLNDDLLEARVTQYERDFDRIRMTVHKEVLRFEKEKAKDLKSQIIKYLEAMLQSQQQLIKFWETFLPEVKAIRSLSLTSLAVSGPKLRCRNKCNRMAGCCKRTKLQPGEQLR